MRYGVRWIVLMVVIVCVSCSRQGSGPSAPEPASPLPPAGVTPGATPEVPAQTQRTKCRSCEGTGKSWVGTNFEKKQKLQDQSLRETNGKTTDRYCPECALCKGTGWVEHTLKK